MNYRFQFWFKNAMIYRLTKSLDWSAQTLSTALGNNQYHPCHQSEQSKFGWSQPLKDFIVGPKRRENFTLSCGETRIGLTCGKT